MDAASASASTASGRIAMALRTRSAPSGEAKVASMFVMVAPGATAFTRSAVAKRAGVGQGSLYRHFPDRTALAAAVFEENVE